jgi:hypothetical protein
LSKDADPAVSNKASRRGGKGVAMGEVIQFPDETGHVRGGRYIDASAEPATVIILPVIRVDRDPGGSNGLEPDTGNTPGRRRRRRIAR